MKIKGIGTIAKNKAMEILTAEGRKAVRSGDITTEELAEMMCKRIRAGFCPALILTLKYSIRVTPTSF